jgi:hypothetical protein
MNILVCGGRNYHDKAILFATLDKLDAVDIVIQGGALGADALASIWAYERGVHCATVPALWSRYGKAAGAFRNRAMLALAPELVVAFPGGKGTASMVTLAKAHGIAVIEAS